jgi:hypothetical protein
MIAAMARLLARCRTASRCLSRGLAAAFLVACSALSAPALAAPPLWQSSIILGDGQTFTGVGQGAAVTSSPMILSTNAGLAGSDPAEAQLCFIGTLDPAKVTGKIVVCDRGVNARTEKSQAVRDAGGVGMILANPTPNTLDADVHAVPTVHVDSAAGAAIKAYASTAAATASLTAGVRIFALSTTALVSSVKPSRSGMPVTFTATVDAGALAPEGSVTFTVGGLPIPGCTAVALTARQASCTVSPFNTITMEAAYSGDDGLNPSSATLAHQVEQPPPAQQPQNSPPEPQTATVPEPAISELKLRARCVRRSKAGRVRVAMSMQLARPAALQILVERAVGSRGRRRCPPPRSRGETTTRFRPAATLHRDPVAAGAAALTRQVTLRPRLAPGFYRLTIRAELDDASLSPPVRGFVRVLR